MLHDVLLVLRGLADNLRRREERLSRRGRECRLSFSVAVEIVRKEQRGSVC